VPQFNRWTKKHTAMDLVTFITFESGTDLIVSYAVCDPHDYTLIRSLTIMRTPKYEVFLYEWERGASVSFEREGEEADERNLLREVEYSPEEKTVRVHTDSHTYALDLRKIESEDLAIMCQIYRKMNFDSSIVLRGF